MFDWRYSLYQLLVYLSIPERLSLNKIKVLIPEELYPYMGIITLVEINI